jgi:hypothetical protein
MQYVLHSQRRPAPTPNLDDLYAFVPTSLKGLTTHLVSSQPIPETPGVHTPRAYEPGWNRHPAGYLGFSANIN